jgi:SAM-dependent methyltransferase
VDKRSIVWADHHITPRYPHCHFLHADLLNNYYNPGGKLNAEEFSFPYPSQSLDFAFAISVFTHLLPGVTMRFFKEIRRVLKPRGKALLTFLLLDGQPETVNDTTIQRSARPGGPIKWHHHGEYSVIYPDKPELIVAYQQSAVLEMLRKNYLPLDRIHRGSWSEPEHYLSFQDVIVIRTY